VAHMQARIATEALDQKKKEEEMLTEITQRYREVYNNDMGKWSQANLTNMVTDPEKQNLTTLKQSILSLLANLHQSQTAFLTSSKSLENGTFNIAKNLEFLKLGEIHKHQQAHQNEIKDIEMLYARQAWKLEKKNFKKMFEVNAALSKKIPEILLLLKQKRTTEKEALKKDQLIQQQKLQEIERLARQKLSELREELRRSLNEYHSSEDLNLKSKQDIELLGVEFLFQKVFCILEHGGFSKCSSAEPKLQEILDKEERAISAVLLESQDARSRGEAYLIMEKEETFLCVFDNINKFLYK